MAKLSSRKSSNVGTADGTNSPLEEKGKDEAIGLKAKMSLMNGVTVIVGSIIGSGK